MSVRPISLRGRQYWEVRVIRDGGAFDRRRYLDRKRFLKTEAKAAEAELITEYEHNKEAPKTKRSGQRARTTTTTTTIPSTTTEATTTETPARRRRRASDLDRAEPATPSTPTFAEFVERYLALQDPRRSDYANKVRELRTYLVPELGALPIDAIGRSQIDALKARLRAPSEEKAVSRRSLNRKEPTLSRRRKGASKSPKTINNILGVLRSVLLLAAEYELVARPPRIRMEKLEKRDAAFLDFEEAESLLATTAAAWREVVRMAIRTGLRQGELQELRWNDLSFGPRAYVRVSRSVRRSSGGAREVKTTKGARPRSVPLTSDIVAALLAHRRGARDDALVFPDERGSYFDADRFRRALDEAAKAAKVNKHVHPHLLRHTFASHAMMRGVPVQVIQKWLGHAHVTTTERYAHLRPDSGDELIELLAPGPDPDPPARSGTENGDDRGDDRREVNEKTPLRAL
jgi:integrase